jgi:small subunit ribosomal protein S2
VIPGNDDALRAIRLFASKVSDSVIEGAQAVTDKQLADIQAGVTYSENVAVGVAGAGEGEPVPVEPQEAEDVSMEDVLGKGARRTAHAEEAIESQSA